MLKKYKFGFDFWGLLLFLIIMIPNLIWVAAVLCVLIKRDRKKIGFTPLIIAAIICCLLYFTGWVFYYIGVTNAVVILGLTIPPCLAFLFFSIDRKNSIAIIPTLIFTVCHLIYGAVNFIS